MAKPSTNERSLRLPHGAWLLGATALLLLGSAGCASMFMAGSAPVSAPPANPTGKWTVVACKDATGSSFNIPGGINYYLEQVPGALALYEFDAKGNGSKITNHWQDGEGLHFFTHIHTSHAFELILPEDHKQPGTRKVFLRGTYETSKDGSGVVRPRGAPGATCQMTPA